MCQNISETISDFTSWIPTEELIMNIAEIDRLIQKLELAIHHNAYLSFDEMLDIKNFLHTLNENSPRQAIFSQQLDLFTK